MTIDKELAAEIVDRIVSDIWRRRGLGDEWDQIDPDIQEEITEEWLQLIVDTVEEYE